MKNIRTELQNLATTKHQAFTKSLIPNTLPLMGVRLPALRKVAKQFSQEEAIVYITQWKSQYHEESMLKMILLGRLRGAIGEILGYVEQTLPEVIDWAMCDTLCGDLKITKHYPEEVWAFIEPKFASPKEFTARFATVMGLRYFINDHYVDLLLEKLLAVTQPDYYAKIAVGWALAECFISYPEKTFLFLRDTLQDQKIKRFAIRKIVESRKPTNEQKEKVKGLR